MSRVQFLGTASDIAREMRKLLRSHGSSAPIRIAVAFWGHGAEEIIECSTYRYQIICNLRSGGTNPDVIRAVAGRSNVSILQIDTPHAKVLISDNGALISSANLSTNGLALEGVNSQTWEEAGIVLPVSAPEVTKVIKWFAELWDRARPITKSDLEDAERAWAQRRALPDESGPGSSRVVSVATDGLTLLRTVEFPGRAPMKQVYLRSGASIVALRGCAGGAMPASAFKFLFCGGTARAFEHHQSKFENRGGTLKLREDYIGYFIGPDGSISAANQPGRLKSFSDEVVHSVALWMRGEGPRPIRLEGNIVEARFSL